MSEIIIAVAMWCSIYNNESLFYGQKLSQTQKCREALFKCIETSKDWQTKYATGLNQLKCFKDYKL